MNDPTYITPVLLLCANCREPIKATITTAQWVKVEWIGPEGQCRGCYASKGKDVSVGPTGVQAETELGTVKATRNYDTPTWTNLNDND